MKKIFVGITAGVLFLMCLTVFEGACAHPYDKSSKSMPASVGD